MSLISSKNGLSLPALFAAFAGAFFVYAFAVPGGYNGYRLCSADYGVRWVATFLSAGLLVAISVPPTPAVAQMLRCASHSLSRQEIARAEAVARHALPSSTHLVAIGACWNADFARVGLETPKILTPEGVHQNWTVWCQRDESTWRQALAGGTFEQCK